MKDSVVALARRERVTIIARKLWLNEGAKRRLVMHTNQRRRHRHWSSGRTAERRHRRRSHPRTLIQRRTRGLRYRTAHRRVGRRGNLGWSAHRSRDVPIIRIVLIDGVRNVVRLLILVFVNTAPIIV